MYGRGYFNSFLSTAGSFEVSATFDRREKKRIWISHHQFLFKIKQYYHIFFQMWRWSNESFLRGIYWNNVTEFYGVLVSPNTIGWKSMTGLKCDLFAKSSSSSKLKCGTEDADGQQWLILISCRGQPKWNTKLCYFFIWYQFGHIKWVEFNSNKMVEYLYIQVANIKIKKLFDTEDYIYTVLTVTLPEL